MDKDRIKKILILSILFGIMCSVILALMGNMDILTTAKLGLFIAFSFFVFGTIFGMLRIFIKDYTRKFK